MARPRTKSKPKPKAAKPEPEIAPVRVGRCTGLDVPEAKAKKILAAHVAGMSIREICRAFNTSHHTTIALIHNRPKLLQWAQGGANNDWCVKAKESTRLICPPIDREEFCGPITRDFLADIFGYLRAADFSAQHSGIYFMFRGSKCVYVGQSKCVAARCGQHLCNNSDSPKAFDRVMYAPVSAEMMTETERTAIRILNPEYNRQRHFAAMAA
jgi:hypothetical protein